MRGGSLHTASSPRAGTARAAKAAMTVVGRMTKDKCTEGVLVVVVAVGGLQRAAGDDDERRRGGDENDQEIKKWNGSKFERSKSSGASRASGASGEARKKRRSAQSAGLGDILAYLQHRSRGPIINS